MAIGGFNGTDPTPTLAQFQQYVRDGKIHYFIAGGGFGGGGGSVPAVAARRARRRRSPPGSPSNFTSQTVGGVTVYDLTTSST